MFSVINKKVGAIRTPVDLPDLVTAVKLLSKVIDADLAAFEEVVKYYRFARSPKDDYEEEVLVVICEALREGKYLWQ